MARRLFAAVGAITWLQLLVAVWAGYRGYLPAWQVYLWGVPCIPLACMPRSERDVSAGMQVLLRVALGLVAYWTGHPWLGQGLAGVGILELGALTWLEEPGYDALGRPIQCCASGRPGGQVRPLVQWHFLLGAATLWACHLTLQGPYTWWQDLVLVGGPIILWAGAPTLLKSLPPEVRPPTPWKVLLGVGSCCLLAWRPMGIIPGVVVLGLGQAGLLTSAYLLYRSSLAGRGVKLLWPTKFFRDPLWGILGVGIGLVAGGTVLGALHLPRIPPHLASMGFIIGLIPVFRIPTYRPLVIGEQDSGNSEVLRLSLPGWDRGDFATLTTLRDTGALLSLVHGKLPDKGSAVSPAEKPAENPPTPPLGQELMDSL